MGGKSRDVSIPVLLNGSYDSSTWTFPSTVGNQTLNINTSKKIELSSGCPHSIDGAVKVAEYILKEIKMNLKSKEAESIRYLMDYQQKRMKAWRNLRPWQQVMQPVPTPQPVAALAIWTQQVFRGHIWDHKHLIYNNAALKSLAIARKLPPLDDIRKKKKIGEPISNSFSHWHKYLQHDYFYDVWSNIHYGYVGLAVGIGEEILLSGSNLAQFLDNKGSGVQDAPDDILCIKIGFRLYRRFGTWADQLTAQHILDELEKENLNESRETHLCFHPNKNELKNEG